MSFDKDYPNRKDRRRPYRGSKDFDRSCRNHGSCDWCASNRQHQASRAESMVSDKEIKEAVGRSLLICGFCGCSDGTVRLDLDPYVSDVYDQDIEVLICAACYEERCHDI